VASVERKWLQVAFKSVLAFKILWSQASHLVVEKLCCVEDGLFLLTRHLVEKVSVVGVLNQVDAAVCMFLVAHVSEHVSLLLLGTDPSG
jgi:hypothetical protein